MCTYMIGKLRYTMHIFHISVTDKKHTLNNFRLTFNISDHTIHIYVTPINHVMSSPLKLRGIIDTNFKRIDVLFTLLLQIFRGMFRGPFSPSPPWLVLLSVPTVRNFLTCMMPKSSQNPETKILRKCKFIAACVNKSREISIKKLFN